MHGASFTGLAEHQVLQGTSATVAAVPLPGVCILTALWVLSVLGLMSLLGQPSRLHLPEWLLAKGCPVPSSVVVPVQVSGDVLPDNDAALAACKELARRLGRQHPVQATFRQLEGKCSASSGCQAMGMTAPRLVLAPALGSTIPCGSCLPCLRMVSSALNY